MILPCQAIYLQFHAVCCHAPNGDFAVFLKKLLKFRMLRAISQTVAKGQPCFYQVSNGGMNQLENNESTQALMDCANPTLIDVENKELIGSERLVHWAANNPKHRAL